MSIAVISSIYGDYDQPKVPALQPGVDEYILVTDRTYDCEPWKVVTEPHPQLHPRLAAKIAKCRPDLYTDADITIWVDGHLKIISPTFVEWAVDFLGDGLVAQLPHPSMTRVADEAEFAATLSKYQGLPLRRQAWSYIEAGYPDGWGLWATGLIVRRSASETAAFGSAWLTEQVRWTVNDQISEAPVLWRRGLRPVDLSGSLHHHWAFVLGRHVDGSS
jgi:hypothetical protein